MALTQIKSSNITDGTIVNTDINAAAAITASKLSGVESGLTSVQVFTSSGTWTRPTDITKVIVEVAGGGGSGCKASTEPTINGGGGGGYAKKFLDVSSIATSTLVVGSAGAAIADGAGTAAGNAGGTSSWTDGTNTITCTGGDGGSLTADQMTNGGTATGGDINIPGGRTAANWSYGFYGGSPHLGTAGQGNFDTAGVTKYYNAGGYGAGGGGGANPSGSGAGAPCVILVWEYK